MSKEAKGWCLVWKEPNGAGKARSLVVLQEGLQDGTHRDHPLRLGWTIEQSRNHLLRQIKGKLPGPPLDVLISSVSPESFIKLQRKEMSISSHLPPTWAGELLANLPGPGHVQGAATASSLSVFCVPGSCHSHGWVPAACWQW